MTAAARLLALLATLALAACGSAAGPRVLLTVGATAPVSSYDLHVKQEGAAKALLHTGFSQTGRDISTDPFKIGLTLPGPGRYKIGVVGAIGPTLQAHADFAAGGREFYWATELDASGDSQASGQLVEALPADDFDLDGIPGGAWQANAPAVPLVVTDCDDSDPSVQPFADETCSIGADQDCDGKQANCDQDGDGDPDDSDCNPTDPTIHHPTMADPYPESPNCCGYALGKSGAESFMKLDGDKLCHKGTCGDMIDQDCNGLDTPCSNDNDCDQSEAGPNQPGGCMVPTTAGGTDCNDCNKDVNPKAPEICDQIDNNCNGAKDETCVACDLDGDGYQRSDPPGCPDGNDTHPGMVDCDDDDAGVFPGSTSTPVSVPAMMMATCAGVEGPASAACALRGACHNKDALGMPQDADCSAGPHTGCPPPACDADGDGFVINNGMCGGGPYDCNDNDPQTFPGAPAPCGEVGTPHNCVQLNTCIKGGATDRDGDGWDTMNDCDDNDPTIHPWAADVCNGKDDDCDGLKDEGNPDASGVPIGVKACTDSDVSSCGQVKGRCVCSATSVASLYFDQTMRTACAGENGAVDQGAGSAQRCYGAGQPDPEVCDGADNDCNGQLDDMVVDCAAVNCCGATGCSMLADILNCGMCGKICTLAHATPDCVAQMCTIKLCDPGYGNCDGLQSSGCEVNIGGDINNCGLCGKRCTPPANASSVGCSSGACTITGCNGTRGDCNGVFSDGCEVDTNNSVANCGACNRPCVTPNGTPGCSSGACTVSCNPNYGNCDASAANGCEVSFASDPTHCGNCTTQCVVSGNIASVACTSGMCKVASCKAGTADCDGSYGNGCEVNTNTDASHCGSCTTSCSGNPAGNKCVNGGCGCLAGGDCGTTGDGCNTSNVCTCRGGAYCTGGLRCKASGCG